LLTKGILHSDFAGNFYVTVNKGGKFKVFDSDDALIAIDDAMGWANE